MAAQYDTEIDFTSENTVTIMIREILPGSDVLEFGPASGRLTKYLKEKMSCRVWIVEIDETAGTVAKEYSQQALIGSQGDIEIYQWKNAFRGQKFDYILFADVLEHLRDVEHVLTEARPFLKESGKILVSIPNICHNSVLIEMFYDNFNYQDTGLLDKTHFHFWTQNSFEEMALRVGLHPVKKMATRTQVGHNEFDVSYEDLKGGLRFPLKSKNTGELYQFVYVLVSQPTVCENLIPYRQDRYFIQWFFQKNDDYDIENSHLEYLDFQRPQQSFIIKVPHGCFRWRFDPINAPCAVKLSVLLNRRNEGPVQAKCLQESNATISENGLFIFNTDDPQFIFNNSDGQEREYRLAVEYLVVDNDEFIPLVSILASHINKSRSELEQQNEYIDYLEHFISKFPVNLIHQLYQKWKRLDKNGTGQE